MKKILWILPLGVLFLSGCSLTPNYSATKSGTLSTNSAENSSQKLSDQSYFPNAYLISSETLSADATTALSGFKMEKKTMPDGSIQINLKALEPQYHDQSYTLKSGEQLYFIDKFLADDQDGKESNIGDDTAVVVNSEGNVTVKPAGF